MWVVLRLAFYQQVFESEVGCSFEIHGVFHLDVRSNHGTYTTEYSEKENIVTQLKLHKHLFYFNHLFLSWLPSQRFKPKDLTLCNFQLILLM